MGRSADLLRFAAAPLFAVMAVLTASSGADAMDILCAAHGSSWDLAWLTGMAPMYVLMSAVHLPPWLKLISDR
ncbi:MAG: hypothetical protein K0Q70_1401 [Rhodospirillales bacterium]|jgi:hypothetical protein|nr:hypothetical protein [Rhodospirillales bacterium]